MLELDETNTLSYLRLRGDVPDLDQARVELLGWGVSNVVLRVYRQSGEDLVIKQCREKLRTKTDWFSRLDRIFREIGMLKCLYPLLPCGVIPQILFEDRQNYLFGMEAIPEHVVWKQHLLEGTVDLSVADRLGTYLSKIHSSTANNPELRQAWGDLQVFDELRLDPFYRYLAKTQPQVRDVLEDLVRENQVTSLCLVLADFSPKNILIVGNEIPPAASCLKVGNGDARTSAMTNQNTPSPARIVLVDFETGHYGDPAFDLGFFLSHLLLKTVRMRERFDEYAQLTVRFWENYWQGMEPVISDPLLGHERLSMRSNKHLAACMWSRLDGKSTVDYIQDERLKQSIREFCKSLLNRPKVTWQELLETLYTTTA